MSHDYDAPGGGQNFNQMLAKQGAETLGGSYREPTIAERIDLSVKKAEQQLADAKRMKEIFDRNPDLEELINLMNKGRI